MIPIHRVLHIALALVLAAGCRSTLAAQDTVAVELRTEEMHYRSSDPPFVVRARGGSRRVNVEGEVVSGDGTSPQQAKLIRVGSELHLVIEAPRSIIINVMGRAGFHATLTDVPPGKYRLRVFYQIVGAGQSPPPVEILDGRVTVRR